MTPPCRNCKYKDNTKLGRYLTKDGRSIKGVTLAVLPKGYKINPCYPDICSKPAEYDDYVCGTVLLPPIYPDHPIVLPVPEGVE